MRRLIAALALALAAAPAARAASLAVVPRAFSPALGALAVSAAASRTQLLGVELTTPKGNHLGWISAPAPRQLVSLFWDGSLDGAPVPDGFYDVRLVSGRDLLARSPLRIDTVAPTLGGLAADDGDTPFAGDSSLLTSVSPNGDGVRDAAQLHFTLPEAATVTLEAARTTSGVAAPVFTETRFLRAGPQTLTWSPASALGPRTYLLHLTVKDTAGNANLYGPGTPYVGRFPRAPVVRVLGLDASFPRASYAPGEIATLRVSTDEPSFTVQIYHAGPEHVETGSDSVLNGVPVSAAGNVSWHVYRNGPGTVRIGIGPWPSGLYFAQLTAPDGRVGYAPFVVRPPVLGASARVAVVEPSRTWQAYNFYDANGDGWGDTWYVGPPHQSVALGRPFLRRGVPPFFRRYDLGFLHWLSRTGKQVDFLADSDLEAVPSGEDLARAYDLIVFPGHTEYVTQHLYDIVERYRDLGGNLAFLAANNFFWRVTDTDGILRRDGQWRRLGRPEARLIGVQYRGNDEGHRQGVFVVRDPASASWLWDGTGLEPGGTFGDFVGGYGIEIDATTPDSPPGTQVLAEIPDLFGPGLTAQMTYYETSAGAKVFAAGALDFGGSVAYWPMRHMLDNLWARLSAP